MRNPLLLCAALVTAMPSGAVSLPVTVDIELLSQVAVQGRDVKLGDIAYLSSSDLQSLRRLLALPIGDAPKPGREAVVDRESLARWIRMNLPVRPGQLTWQGAQQTVVTSGKPGSMARVRRGEWITLRLQSGPVQVERRAELMQETAVGEVTRVRMPGVDVPVDARMVAKDRAEAL